MSETQRPEPRWLSPILIRAIHADQVRQHGGALGLRDENLLDSPIARARSRWHYETDAELADLAAAYGIGLVRNHPFVDGNKRVAFQAMYVFLGLNGWRIAAEEPDVVDLMLAAASGTLDESQLADWLRAHVEPR
ncbi:MAG: type II toxin-antitoxin system death-on-curing family toxin [Longimicrobiales bacterium]